MVNANEPFSPIVTKGGRMLLPLGLLAILAVSVAVGAWQFLLVPADDRLARSQAAYGGAVRAESRLFAARKAQEELTEIWMKLPARKEFASLAAAISELAKADQVEVPGMHYGLQKAEDGLPVRASLSFRAIGDYAAIRRFIYSLETSSSYLIIESLDAARAPVRRTVKGGRAPSLVVFNIQVLAFLRQDPPPSGRTT